MKLSNSEGKTLLYQAASNCTKKDNLQVVEMLLTLGVDVNCRNTNKRTAMHVAAERGNLQLVEVLISRGADLNAKDS